MLNSKPTAYAGYLLNVSDTTEFRHGQQGYGVLLLKGRAFLSYIKEETCKLQ